MKAFVPGFDSDVGSLGRSCEGEYDEYHSSPHNLAFVCGAQLEDAAADRHPRMRAQVGELRGSQAAAWHAAALVALRRRAHASDQLARLGVLTQAYGSTSLLDIAHRSGLELETLVRYASRLSDAGLLVETEEAA